MIIEHVRSNTHFVGHRTRRPVCRGTASAAGLRRLEETRRRQARAGQARTKRTFLRRGGRRDAADPDRSGTRPKAAEARGTTRTHRSRPHRECPEYPARRFARPRRRLGETGLRICPLRALAKLRFFAGMSLGDAAAALGSPRRTADRHWAFVRAWLPTNRDIPAD